MGGDIFSTLVLAVLFKAVVLCAAVAKDTIARKMRAIEDMMHQGLWVGKVQLAVPEWAGPVFAIMGQFAVENEEIEGHVCKDCGLGAGINLGRDHVD